MPRIWITEGIHPGIAACSHHVGRWRLHREGETFFLRQKEGVKPYASADPDSSRVWWNEVGVHQNLIFAVQPDPISGMHCWHQKVVVESARRAGSGGTAAAAVAQPAAAADRGQLPPLTP